MAVREQDEGRPTNNYGRSKLNTAELVVHAAGVPFAILRSVVHYGRNLKANIKLLVRPAFLPLPLPVEIFNSRRSLQAIDDQISLGSSKCRQSFSSRNSLVRVSSNHCGEAF